MKFCINMQLLFHSQAMVFWGRISCNSWQVTYQTCKMDSIVKSHEILKCYMKLL